ncbi:MAG: hypothetical protein FWH03_08945, partial [Firmicutes bacterium]|nr:hypothetical protein [Bacillota bacterium]
MGDSHLLANSTLTITGNGTLFIELGDERTAFQMFGNAHLIINSGLIFVAETMHRASVDTVSGRLTVNGGTLLVNGLIGSDHDYSSGPITINGGAVVAQGIGFGGYMYATYRAITINGGYVRTNFIGSSHVRGDDNYMGVHAMQPITITGGVIETNHIGASWDCPYNSPLDNIPVIIEGGMINAGTNGIVATTLTQTGGLLASARLHIRDTDSFDGGERIIGGNYDFENSVADIIAETIRQAEQAEEEAKQLAAEKLALAKSSAIAEVEAYAFIVGYTDSTQAFADAINLSDTIDAVTTALVAAIDAIIEAVAPGYDTTVEGQLALAKSAAILQIEAYAALVEYEGSITPYLNAINNAGSIAFVA